MHARWNAGITDEDDVWLDGPTRMTNKEDQKHRNRILTNNSSTLMGIIMMDSDIA